MDITAIVLRYPELRVIWAAREKGPPGFYRRRGRWREIVVDPRLPEHRRRHVLAHELAHFMMDTEHWSAGRESDEEHCADRIADLLLVPTNRLVRFLMDTPVATPGQVAAAFRVPTETAVRRLQEVPL